MEWEDPPSGLEVGVVRRAGVGLGVRWLGAGVGIGVRWLGVGVGWGTRGGVLREENKVGNR